jgi:CRP-like cAMP-binding protein
VKGIHVIQCGKVMVTKGGVLIRNLGPGEVFGENCVIDASICEEPYLVHTVTALEPLETCRLHLDDLEMLVCSTRSSTSLSADVCLRMMTHADAC